MGKPAGSQVRHGAQVSLLVGRQPVEADTEENSHPILRELSSMLLWRLAAAIGESAAIGLHPVRMTRS
jgi:hypothetical protein